MELLLEDCLIYNTPLNYLLSKHWDVISFAENGQYIYEDDGIDILLIKNYSSFFCKKANSGDKFTRVTILGIEAQKYTTEFSSDDIQICIRRIEKLFKDCSYSSWDKFYRYPVFALMHAAIVQQKLNSAPEFDDISYKNCSIGMGFNSNNLTICGKLFKIHKRIKKSIKDMINGNAPAEFYFEMISPVKSARRV